MDSISVCPISCTVYKFLCSVLYIFASTYNGLYLTITNGSAMSACTSRLWSEMIELLEPNSEYSEYSDLELEDKGGRVANER
jgi:hypothetical protein